MGKVTNLILKFVGPSLKQSSTKVLVALVLAYALIILMFIIGWAINAWVKHQCDLTILIELLKVMSGPSMIASIFFVMKGLTDKNNNGIPDNLEEEKK